MISRETQISSNLLFKHAINNGGNTSYKLVSGRNNSIGGFFCINDAGTDVSIQFDLNGTSETLVVKTDEQQGVNIPLQDSGTTFNITATGNYRILFFVGV